jgi:hypothetical protein
MIEISDGMVLAVVPNKAFEVWLKEVMRFFETEWPDGKNKAPVEKLNEDSLLYLVPTFNNADDALRFIKNQYLDLFRHSLMYWCKEERCWPKDLSYDLFNQFFSVEFHSRVYDLTGNEKE